MIGLIKLVNRRADTDHIFKVLLKNKYDVNALTNQKATLLAVLKVFLQKEKQLLSASKFSTSNSKIQSVETGTIEEKMSTWIREYFNS